MNAINFRLSFWRNRFENASLVCSLKCCILSVRTCLCLRINIMKTYSIYSVQFTSNTIPSRMLIFYRRVFSCEKSTFPFHDKYIILYPLVFPRTYIVFPLPVLLSRIENAIISVKTRCQQNKKRNKIKINRKQI